MTAHARQPLPSELRERVLAAAWTARPVGRAVPEPSRISPVTAFSRAAEGLDQTLDGLATPLWRMPVLRGLDVHGLVGHLIGVEHDMQRALSGDPAVADADHVQSTQAAADQQTTRTSEQTRRDWREATDRTLTLLESASDLDRVVGLHRTRLPLGSLLVARAFELWTHDNDIRTAAELALTRPDPPTLTLMTRLAVRLLPYGIHQVDPESAPVDLHLVLTGPGGGTWNIALDDRTDHDRGDVPDVGIVADAFTFCRLVANRIHPEDLHPHLTGVVAHVPRILAGAAALALD
jgi:uncharacterized protein (TIGR03083 family)